MPVIRWHSVAACAVLLALASALVRAVVVAQPAAPPGAALFVRSLQNPAERRETRSAILDTPVLPGSVVKAVTLVTALEEGAISAATTHLCRRRVTIDGHTYVCAHPDLKRALTPAEALAYSCNDFFVSLGQRLTRDQVNRFRLAAGLPPLGAAAIVSAALVGLDGPRVTPRALLDVLVRLTATADRPVPLSESTRRVLRDGLRDAARFGTAAALGERGITALAKTGTAPMPGGGALGLLVALTPADAPTRGIVVVAPGAAGQDAASIAADELLRDARPAPAPAPPTVSAAKPPAPPTVSAPRPAAGAAVDAAAPMRLGVTLADGRVRVETIALDEYVGQVVAGEGQPGAGDAAQQALAIAARTFAVANRQRHRREGFDLCDTTHCQVPRPATPASRRAAAATSGRVLLRDGVPATVFYSALCGGHTERASEVWPGGVDYAEQSRPDEACQNEPPWTSEMRADQIERALRAAGFRGDRVRDIRVLQRNESGRVSRLRIDGFVPGELSGHDFRTAVGRTAGWQTIKSTAFEVQRTGVGYTFRGRGFGHGVGLCVIGAGRRAASGSTAEEILRFYFPALTVSPLATTFTTAVTPAAPAPPAAPVPTPPSAPVTQPTRDVLLALPAADESERTRMVQAVRAARDRIAGLAKVPAPVSLRVTVHPTVEAFGRATGQPWWVSGATDGTAIDLLPLAILRQRGQFERTIRHEVAHALVDAALAGRPLWVREGAAAYFANPEAAVEVSGRFSCPTDDEFLRPLSAGTHRTAYARAEACFRRALASGQRWTDVGR